MRFHIRDYDTSETIMRMFLLALGATLLLAGCGPSGNSGNSSEKATSQSAQASAQASAKQNAATGEFESKAAKRSYALGMDIGKSLQDAPFDLSIAHLTAGIKDVLNDRQPRLGDKELRATLQALVSDMQTAKRKQQAAKAKKNAQAGKAFRAQYKKQDGVTVTDSGLMYKVLKKGEGDSPDLNDRVKVHYVGHLIDGTVFDSSRKRGKPVVFPVNAVIPGWTEALQLMKEGAKYELVIPPDLAYGARGAGAKIGPNETLVFEVTLLKVLPKDGKDSGDTGGTAK